MVFSGPTPGSELKQAEAQQAELCEQIGRLKMELEWLKKKVAVHGIKWHFWRVKCKVGAHDHPVRVMSFLRTNGESSFSCLQWVQRIVRPSSFASACSLWRLPGPETLHRSAASMPIHTGDSIQSGPCLRPNPKPLRRGWEAATTGRLRRGTIVRSLLSRTHMPNGLVGRRSRSPSRCVRTIVDLPRCASPA